MPTNKPTTNVAVDLDGVLAEFKGEWDGKVENIGKLIPGAREFVERLRKRGLRIIIHTCRVNAYAEHIPNDMHPERSPDQRLAAWAAHVLWVVEDWLDRNEIPYDEIWTRPGKPYCVAYIDDKSVLCDPRQEYGRENEHIFDRAFNLIDVLAEFNTGTPEKNS